MCNQDEKELLEASAAVANDCPPAVEEPEVQQPEVKQAGQCPVSGGEFVVPSPTTTSKQRLGKSASIRTSMILGTVVILPLLSLAGLGGWLRLSYLCKYFLAVVGVGVFKYASRQLLVVNCRTSRRRLNLFLKLAATWSAILIGFTAIHHLVPTEPPLYAMQEPETEWQRPQVAELPEESLRDFKIMVHAGHTYGLGLKAAQNDRFESAVQLFTTAIKLCPNHAPFYVARGCAILHGFNEHEFAIADHTAAIKLQPDFAPAYFNRADSYWDAGHHREALEDCNRAINRNPQFAQAYWLRGQVLTALEEYDRAINDLLRADQLGCRNAPWYPWQESPWQPFTTTSLIEFPPHSTSDQSLADSSKIQGAIVSDLQSLIDGMVVGKAEDDEIYDIAFPGDLAPDAYRLTTVGKSAQLIHCIRIAENEPILMLKLMHCSQFEPLGVEQVTATSGQESATCYFSHSNVMRDTAFGVTVEFATMVPNVEPSASRFLDVTRNSKPYNVEVKGVGGFTTFSPGSTAREHASRMLALFSALRQRPELVKDVQRLTIGTAEFQKAVEQALEAQLRRSESDGSEHQKDEALGEKHGEKNRRRLDR